MKHSLLEYGDLGPPFSKGKLPAHPLLMDVHGWSLYVTVYIVSLWVLFEHPQTKYGLCSVQLMYHPIITLSLVQLNSRLSNRVHVPAQHGTMSISVTLRQLNTYLNGLFLIDIL